MAIIIGDPKATPEIDPGWFLLQQEIDAEWQRVGKVSARAGADHTSIETWYLVTEKKNGWYAYVTPNGTSNLDVKTRFVNLSATADQVPPSGVHYDEITANCSAPTSHFTRDDKG